MTHTEVIELVATEVGASLDEAHGFVQTFIDIVISRLDAGDEVKIRGFGTFKWVDVAGKILPSAPSGVPEMVIPSGRKLKFFPAKQFKTRRVIMPDEEEGMNKYAVVTEGDNNDKTASKNTVRVCPVCASELDSGGACPKHGTKPFEPDGQ